MCKPLCAFWIVALGILAPPLASAPQFDEGGTAPAGRMLSGVPTCLHDGAEQPPDRARREQAIALAKAINERQGTAAERTRLYVALTQLRNLPPTPKGFSVQLYTDGTGYVVSLKDKLDPCRYAIFSDEAGLLYQSSALAAPLIAERR
jgi:hypothetical protein